MKSIDRKQIERLFPTKIYERGLSYYLNRRVLGLSYNRHKQEWFAEVQGTERYYVDVGLNELDKGKIKTYCECPAFSAYHYCKHLVAVLLEIAEKNQQQDNTELTAQFVKGLVSIEEPTIFSEKIPMQVEYFLSIERGKIWLEIKTGVDHCYVVHRIRDLLDSYKNDEAYRFTSKFTFDPSKHYFLLQDADLLEELYMFIQTGDLFTDRSYEVDNAYDRRRLLIPPINFASLLKKFRERNTIVSVGEKQYVITNILEGELPFSFSLVEQAKSLVLKTSGMTGGIFCPEYKMIFHQGTFYFPTESQLKAVKEVKRIGMYDQELLLPSEQVDTFFSEALPVLRRVSKVEIDQNMTEKIVDHALIAQIYFEKKGYSIVGEVIYRYGNIEINPFSPNDKKDVIILRDVEKEQRIMQFIEQANFHFNGEELYLDMSDEEVLYEFLYVILPKLEAEAEVYLTDSIKRLLVDDIPMPNATVQVETGSNLLEIGFDMSGLDESEVNEVLEAVIEKKRYFRLHSGKLMSLESEEFETIRSIFAGLDVKKSDVQANKITLPAYRSMQIDELSHTSLHYDTSFTTLLSKLKQPEQQVYELPENLQATLRTYQETGYQWFKSLSAYHLGGILADDMGLGKTVQTIAYLLSEKSDQPHLVIAPSSVLFNWRNECRKFAPDLKVAVITGLAHERKQIMEKSKTADVWITSYGIARQDLEELKEYTFETLILDEAQMVKNYFTKTSRAIREIRAGKRFALSGTPIENSIDELWAIFQVVLPGFFPGLNDFRKMDRKKIASLSRPFILRRLKEDVLTELPEKIESVHVSELTKEQKELYVGYLQQLQTETSNMIANNSFKQERMKILAGLTRLRQICCHPSLFIENYAGRSGKLDELIEMIKTLIENGKRMLIFSQFTAMHELIMKELDKVDIDYFYLHGQTPSEERVEMSEAFNGGEKNVFLISLRAGGTGLNLTGADTVILFDLWWNPAVEDQAAGRAHRFGQKNVVQVIRFITDGTIEEKIYELQQKKRELIDQVIQPGETMLTSLSEEDIRALLNIS